RRGADRPGGRAQAGRGEPRLGSGEISGASQPVGWRRRMNVPSWACVQVQSYVCGLANPSTTLVSLALIAPSVGTSGASVSGYGRDSILETSLRRRKSAVSCGWLEGCLVFGSMGCVGGRRTVTESTSVTYLNANSEI